MENMQIVEVKGNVSILTHPLIQHKVSLLRDKMTGSKEFRELVEEISMLIGYEVTRDLPLKEVEIETPIAPAKTNVITGKKLAIVQIMRAGIAMAEGMLKLIPAAKVGHIGIYRSRDTHEPVEYYGKLPKDIGEREILLVDPMLATGGSANAAIDFLKKQGAKAIKLATIICAPEGIEAVTKEHPDVAIFTTTIDECLNEDKYIVPGLGDMGDRIYGTK